MTERGQASPKACGSWPGRLVAGREVLKVAAQRAGPPGRQRRRVVRRRVVRRSGSRGAPAARGAFGLSRGGLPGRLVTVSAGTLQLSLGVLGAGLEGGAGVFGRRDLRFEPGPQPGLVPRGVLAGLGHLPVGGLAGPVQLRAGRLGRLPRLGRVLPGVPGPGSAAATRSSAASRAWAICARAASASCSAAALAVSAPASRASACSATARASPASASARARRRRQNADPGRARSGGPAAPRSCRASSWRRRNAVSAVCSSPGHRVRQPAVPRLRPLSCPRLRLILTARIRASEETLSGLDHRQAPFSADQHSVTGRARAAGTGAFGQPGHPRGGSHGCWAG